MSAEDFLRDTRMYAPSMLSHAERIVTSNLLSDGRTTYVFEPPPSPFDKVTCIYTQAQAEAMVRREVDGERECWRARLENATAQICGLQARVQELMDPIAQVRMCQPPPPMIIQWDAEKVAAERARCARVAREMSAKFATEEVGCWNDGESAERALLQLAERIAEGK